MQLMASSTEEHQRIHTELEQFVLLQKFVAARKREAAAAPALGTVEPPPQQSPWQRPLAAGMTDTAPVTGFPAPRATDVSGQVVCKRCQRTVSAAAFERHWSVCEQIPLVTGSSQPHVQSPPQHVSAGEATGSATGTKRKRTTAASAASEEKKQLERSKPTCTLAR